MLIDTRPTASLTFKNKFAEPIDLYDSQGSN